MIGITENQESPAFHSLIGLNRKRYDSFSCGLMLSNVFCLCHHSIDSIYHILANEKK